MNIKTKEDTKLNSRRNSNDNNKVSRSSLLGSEKSQKEKDSTTPLKQVSTVKEAKKKKVLQTTTKKDRPKLQVSKLKLPKKQSMKNTLQAQGT